MKTPTAIDDALGSNEWGCGLSVIALTMPGNWEADSENRWIIPIGGGVWKIFTIGKQPINSSIQAYDNVETPKHGAD